VSSRSFQPSSLENEATGPAINRKRAARNAKLLRAADVAMKYLAFGTAALRQQRTLSKPRLDFERFTVRGIARCGGFR
jgi:hypothetical protein